MNQQTWINATSLAHLKDRGKTVIKKDDKQIALITSGDQIFAIDNRCPHQGYPLKEGSVDGKSCVLTCQWHNWKFNLKTGKALVGEDHVRTYPTRVEDNQVWIDISEPTPEQQTETIMVGLREGVAKRQYGRISREVARLLNANLDPLVAIRETLVTAHDKVEYGTTHAWAATADWLTLYDEAQDDIETRTLVLAEALDHLSLDTLREAPYPYSKEEFPFTGESFLKAIEAEDEAQAIGMLRGAIRENLSWSDLEPWYTRAALSHYADFGHSLIYVEKVGELLTRFGSTCLEPLLLPLTRSLVYATREDLIPDFKAYAPQLAQKPEPISREVLSPLTSPFRLNTKDALAWVKDSLEKAPPQEVFDVLLSALAKNMLHFDMDYQFAYHRVVKHNTTWLSFSHALTFAGAVSNLVGRYPELWYQALLQMACFLGRNTPYLHQAMDTAPYQVKDAPYFFEEARVKVTDHGYSEPIYSCHLLKTTISVRGLYEQASTNTRADLLAGLNRFLNSPIKEKHVRRTARQALSLIGRKA